MSRPKPKVLVEITNKTTYKTEQVLAAEGIWAVFNPLISKQPICWCSILGPNTRRYRFPIKDMPSTWPRS